MNPKDVRKYIEDLGVSFGENVIVPEEIDTNSCTNFFGTRCEGNVHVTGPRQAHVDRVDPRKNPLGHLKHDVGVPYAVMGTAGFATLGAAISPGNRKKGAAYGAIAGAILGFIADVVAEHNKKQPPNVDF